MTSIIFHGSTKGAKILVQAKEKLIMVLDPVSFNIPQKMLKFMEIRTDAIQANICHEAKELLAKENHKTSALTLLQNGKCQFP